jgi:hypothetical protein
MKLGRDAFVWKDFKYFGRANKKQTKNIGLRKRIETEIEIF